MNNNPIYSDKNNQQEILLIMEKIKERYQLEKEYLIYELATKLYKNGIRSNMFTEQYYQKKINLDEIVKYMIELEPKNDILLYEIKRHQPSSKIKEANINSQNNPNVIEITSYLTRKVKRKGEKKCQNYQK